MHLYLEKICNYFLIDTGFCKAPALIMIGRSFYYYAQLCITASILDSISVLAFRRKKVIARKFK